MEAKLFEVRDKGTFIPVLAVKLDPMPLAQEEPPEAFGANRYLLARAGYGEDRAVQSTYIMVCKIEGGEGSCSSDPYSWGPARTMNMAHKHMIENWFELPTGAVICVETLCGERNTPKESERRSYPA